ncbi:hypothetical protein L1049_023493 [Liquidambar formosana]|uniref:Glucan endo-1,3-beta-D-glucosidase n=1 Tax=Liquidambar formosana TaxID=63359 RepID=A0AAP0RTJ8_LIQFO
MKKAMAYNNNLIAHLRSGNGTPLKPGKKIEAYLFALFVEDMRPGAQGIGVNYGRLGDNLPPPDQVIALYKSNNIQRIRLFDPNPDALKALQGSGLQVILGVVNTDLPTLANDQSAAATWVQVNIIPYAPTVNFRCISLGNELIPSYLASYVLPSMQNLKTALISANLMIPVSTAVFENVLSTSYPPSAGHFQVDAAPFMVPIVQFLEENNYPLLCNVYPYFSYRDDPKNVRLDYALFNTSEGGRGLGDEEMDTIVNAQMYNNNLIAHVVSSVGTPKRPGKGIETYVFAVFNEDLKPNGSEQHYGLFYPNLTVVYPVNFCP